MLASARSQVTGVVQRWARPLIWHRKQAEDATNVDHRADIYSLGCTFYALLVGKTPYGSMSAMEILSKIKTEPIARVDKSFPDPCAASQHHRENGLRKRLANVMLRWTKLSRTWKATWQLQHRPTWTLQGARRRTCAGSSAVAASARRSASQTLSDRNIDLLRLDRTVGADAQFSTRFGGDVGYGADTRFLRCVFQHRRRAFRRSQSCAGLITEQYDR